MKASKVTILPGFHDSLLVRLLERLAEGQTPVDGCVVDPDVAKHVADRAQSEVGDDAAQYPAGPVRWGNFR